MVSVSLWYCSVCGFHCSPERPCDFLSDTGVRLRCPDCGSMNWEMRLPMPIFGPNVTLVYGEDNVPETPEQKIQRLIDEAARD